MGREPQTPDPNDLAHALADLRKVLGDALIIGGIAVIHYGYERTTKDIDILYANWDTKILERLDKFFKTTLKAESGWHHLEHRKNKVRLELVPGGGLTQYGFIPAPKTVGGKDGVITLFGLVWLKMVSGRLNDLGDLSRLATLRFDEMEKLVEKLPWELRERYQEVLMKTKYEMENDPNRTPDNNVRESPAKYGKPKPKRKKVPA